MVVINVHRMNIHLFIPLATLDSKSAMLIISVNVVTVHQVDFLFGL